MGNWKKNIKKKSLVTQLQNQLFRSLIVLISENKLNQIKPKENQNEGNYGDTKKQLKF